MSESLRDSGEENPAGKQWEGLSEFRRTKAGRVQRFVELAKNYGKDEPEKEISVNDALERMTPETALRFLRHINSQLRNERITKKSDIYGDKMHRMVVESGGWGGEKEMVAPEPELQKELFGEYLDAIKRIKDKDKRASLAYYAINNLHLFSDGNGRTSRAVYMLIKNDGDMSAANDVLVHNDKIPEWIRDNKDGDDGVGRKKFISENAMRPVEQINNTANNFLQEQMEEDGLLDKEFGDKSIYIFSVKDKNNLVAVMMSRKNREGLNEEDSKCLNYAMSDNGHGSKTSSLAGLTMAAVLSQKGSAKTVVENSLKNDGLLPIRVNFDSEYTADEIQNIKDTFVGWTPDDYRKTIELYRELKRRQNRMVIKFFTEDMRFDDGKNVAEWAMGK